MQCNANLLCPQNQLNATESTIALHLHCLHSCMVVAVTITTVSLWSSQREELKEGGWPAFHGVRCGARCRPRPADAHIHTRRSHSYR